MIRSRDFTRALPPQTDATLHCFDKNQDLRTLRSQELKSPWRAGPRLLAPGLLLLLVRLILGSFQAAETTMTRPELVLQTGHSWSVNCVAFAPGGQWLASGGADNTIRLWDVATGRELRALTGHTGYINSLSLTRDGQLLASGSNDLTIKIWNVFTGREMRSLNGHTASVQAVAFSADKQWLASGSADNAIKIWDVATGKEIQTLKRHTGLVKTIAFSADGKILASGGADNTVRLWDTTSWRELATLRKHSQEITSLSFSSDNKSIASGSADGVVCLWKIGADRERFMARPNSSAVLALSFSDELLVTASAAGAITYLDLTNGKEVRSLSADPNSAELVVASFSDDGKLLAASTGSKTVNLRSTDDGKSERKLESHSTGFNAVAWSRDRRWLAAGANDHTIRLWQVATGREMPRLSGHSAYVTTISFSQDSRFLASGSESGQLKVWDMQTGREAYGLPSNQAINVVAFSPDGKFLASAGVQQTIQIWELATKRARTFTGHSGEVTSVAFSPDGSLVISGSMDKTIKLWELKTGNTVRTLNNLNDQINAVAFSLDGKSVAAGGADKTVTIWEVATGRPLRTLTGHGAEVLAIAFSPDGKSLASGSADHTIKIWDTESGREARTLSGPSGNVNSVAYSADSYWLVSGSDDGSIMVWSGAKGELVATLVSVRDSDDWLVVSPDGLFDGSPASWNLLLWRFAKNTFTVSPVEAFFNEFYYPGLLADILAGRNPKAKQDISQKDRRQPRIKLQLAGGQTTASNIAQRNVTVQLDISETQPDEEHSEGSGARDLRLFRNGLLVKMWPGDILKGLNKRTLEATIPLIAGENQLSAYSFNRDNVKSSNATLSLNGADSLKRVGIAYVLAIGVGQYENSQYNLNYSVADAFDIGEQLKNQQEGVGHYNPVVLISLVDAEATRANILLALRRLAGTDAGPLPKDAPRVLSKIKAAEPEDAVVVYFSGHGTAEKDRFYLIPHDLGYGGLRGELDSQGLKTILAHSVSDIELEEALRPVDADQLLLVIDACNSGQALEADEKRQGPMNTRGLAQLAYEKGMYVLTASQSDEVAFESSGLKHSYLAYALVEEGIKSGAADTDHNGQVFLKEWFDYATERVPRIRVGSSRAGKQLEEVDPDERRVQRPRVFNMREGGAERFVIARSSVIRTQ
jgi:WD40 repeat protein